MAGCDPLDNYRGQLMALQGKMQPQVNQLRVALAEAGGPDRTGPNGQSLKREIEGAGGRPEHGWGGRVITLETFATSAGRPVPIRVLARMATTGIYLLRGIPRDLQRAARVRAVSEGTTLRWVLLQALREYAAGTWTPQADDNSPESCHDQPRRADVRLACPTRRGS